MNRMHSTRIVSSPCANSCRALIWQQPLWSAANRKRPARRERTFRDSQLYENRLGSWRIFSSVGDSMLDKIRRFVGDASDSTSYKFFEDNAPSWSELEKLLEERKSSIGFVDPNPESGPPNPQSLKRTFGSTEPIKIKLYRDHAAWCPYCQKVRLMLTSRSGRGC